ncbi:membrane-bound lytic murein transglycosylase D [Candidatus Magnetomoraceae bacterium gMMP-15]
MNLYIKKYVWITLIFLILSSAFTFLYAQKSKFTPFNTQKDRFFHEPNSLKDNVAFWKKIYSQVSLNEGLLHDREYPLIIYNKIYVGNRHRHRLSKYLEKYKNELIQQLRRINTVSSSNWTDKERIIVAKFQKYASMSELKKAEKRIRFQLGQKERFKKGLERSGMFIDKIRSILKQYGIPLRLAYLPHVESSFNCNAYSKVGASGLWQFMRGTGKRFLKINYLIDERSDPILSTIAAAKLLKSNYEILNSWPLAITAYNHGVNGMKKAAASTGSNDIAVIIEKHKSRSFKFASKNFYSCFLAASEIAENYTKYFKNVNIMPPFSRKNIKLTHYIQPEVLCKYLNISLEQFKENNPALRPILYRQNRAVPKNYRIYIPTSMSRWNAKKIIASIPDKYKSTEIVQTKYRVKKGDYLGKIAKKTGSSSRAIACANNLSKKNRIYPGQVLCIPHKGIKISSIINHSIGKKSDKKKAITKKSDKKKVIAKKFKKNKTLTNKKIKIKYRVKKGDSLDLIARKTGSSIKQIARANNILRSNKIHPGQILHIPKKSGQSMKKSKIIQKKYRIKKGDTLDRIARKTGIPAKIIASVNKIKLSHKIYPGQVLNIPDKYKYKNQYFIVKYYKVIDGDNLNNIARKTGVSVKDISRANRISRRDRIYKGQILRIPRKI